MDGLFPNELTPSTGADHCAVTIVSDRNWSVWKIEKCLQYCR